MAVDGLKTWHRVMLAGAVVTAVALAVITFAVHDAKHRILQALGPRTTVGDISLSYPLVTLRDVRIAADPTAGAWPAKEEFHAALVQVRIDIGSLWAYRHGQPLKISDVHVEDGVLVMLRTKGKLMTLPALRETSRAKSAAMGASQVSASGAIDAAAAPVPAASQAASDEAATTSLVVEHARVDRMAVDLYDNTLPGGAMHRVRFEQVHGSIDGIALPALMAPIAVDMGGLLKGVEHDGTVAIKGTLTPAKHDADLDFHLKDVDLIALGPYLLRFGERPVRHGLLDMTLAAHVVDREVNAPGQLTLTGLEFGPGDGTGSFAGVERRAVLAALQKNGRIDIKFTLEGRTDDPKFSLDEKLGIRIAAVLGETVGLSVKGVVEGVGDVFKGLVGASHADKATH